MGGHNRKVDDLGRDEDSPVANDSGNIGLEYSVSDNPRITVLYDLQPESLEWPLEAYP